MANLRIEIPKSTLKKFYSQSPTKSDIELVKSMLHGIWKDPGAGTEVPFSRLDDTLDDAYVVWADRWRIVYYSGNPTIHILQIECDNE